MWVVVHDQQVFSPSFWARPLIGSNKSSDAVVLQQRQTVDGAFVEEVLAIGCAEHLHGHGLLVQGAAVHGAIPAASNQLTEVRTGED